MIEKIKNIGWTGVGILFFILFIFIVTFLVRGGVSFIESHQDLISSINGVIIGLIFILLIFSIIPKLRIFTGTSIVYLTLVWIFLLWLNSLAITYELWGFVGIFVGAIMLGIGIFATAILALFFNGQGIAALILLVTLVIMYSVRALGLWIANKHKNTIEAQSINSNFSE